MALRVTASAAMLGYLLSRFDLASLLPAGHWSTIPWVAAGIGAMLIAIVLSAVRWQQVLNALELPTELSPLVSYSLAGLFVGNFLPSTIGGDVLRVVRLSARNGQRPASFASVVLERLTGFIVLPLITLLALALHPELLHLGAATGLALVMSVATLVTLIVIVIIGINPRLGSRLAGKSSWLRFIGAVHLGLERIRRHPRAAASVLVAAVAYQLCLVLAAGLAAQALGIHVAWGAVMAFIPVVMIAQVLPFSVNGLGLREGALVLLLAPLGVANHDAVALGLLLYGMNVLVSLLGAPAFAVGPRAEPLVAAVAQ
jgi:uncharacterized membrane protein YbhN (UPF0104 family)